MRPVKTIWIAAGGAEAPMYDPKSGENVSNTFDFYGSRMDYALIGLVA